MEDRIKANELRIGNWVRTNVEKFVITSISKDGVNRRDKDRVELFDYEIIHGIPLTEDWLIRFGFEKGKRILQELPKRWISWSYGKEFWIEDRYGETLYEVDNIKYVHQLQNLIFALTQTELNLISKPAQSGLNQKG